MGGAAPPRRQQQQRKWVTVAALGAVIAAMVTLVAFSVPLYRLFCAATGFGGTTQRAAAATGKISDRVVTVRFTTDVAPDLPWRFRPEQNEVKVRLGEEKLVFFSAENLGGVPIVGHAAFNVTPAKVGVYFNKIQCFCFSEERLDAHAKIDMPVDFFVDPKLASDPETREVDTITLSYTFFRSKEPEGAKDLSRFTAPAAPDPQRGAALFAERCAACHALDRNKTGPMLGDLVGRRAGSVAGYAYSPALRRAGISWSAETLGRWLEDPQELVPGARMPIRVPEATARRDIIAYLAAQAHPASDRRTAAAGEATPPPAR
ncbi:MAG TPA: cytochrome c oxidase assembly protein [Stellaceae bacterium]|nr:cytochrome c oxidase assembly protein [Stellaceae bacterium]